MSRRDDLVTFYLLLDRLEQALGGKRSLADCSGRSGWPDRGVYFFFEDGELRSDTGSDPRVIRIGTHALKQGAKTKLWGRLRQHRGTGSSGGGNHRGSVFRDLVGAALAGRAPGPAVPSWAHRSAGKSARDAEHQLECKVSETIRSMSFLWVAVNDDAGPESQRGTIERGAIALLSNYQRAPLDPPSSSWLGHHCDRDRVRSSGLWNCDNVETAHEPAFLRAFEALIAAMERS